MRSSFEKQIQDLESKLAASIMSSKTKEKDFSSGTVADQTAATGATDTRTCLEEELCRYKDRVSRLEKDVELWEGRCREQRGKAEETDLLKMRKEQELEAQRIVLERERREAQQKRDEWSKEL
ncbi:unnamed protein product, partial [Amoebophrya sp. A25]|eukprot:GSA25T00020440001.1